MRLILCWCSVLLLSMQVAAQQAPSLDSRISDVLTRMSESDLHTREVAFDDMMALVHENEKQISESGRAEVLARFLKRHPEQADRIKLGLIRLLGTDNAAFQDKNIAPGTYTEDDTEHYAEVVNIVSSLNDERALPGLVDAMTTGRMAQQAILRYGDKALALVLEKVKDPNPLAQSSALRMSFALLAKRSDPAAHAQVRNLILAYAKAPSGASRTIAVQEIRCLEDRRNFVPLLKEIANSDPLKLPGKALDGGDGNEFYPVRADARQVLRDIENNTGCRH